MNKFDWKDFIFWTFLILITCVIFSSIIFSLIALFWLTEELLKIGLFILLMGVISLSIMALVIRLICI